MTSPSAVRTLYGASKTYGRNRDDPAVRSFDAMMSGKSSPMKASAAHTKWGNTNYVAVRDRKKGHVEAPFKSRELKTHPEDPFSFDTDEKGKTSPTKIQPPAVSTSSSTSYQKYSTRLPASRIFTPGNLEASSSTTRNSFQPSNVSPESLCAIARPGRTYTRSHEGRIKASPTKQRYMDQFIEVGKPVSRDLGASASALCAIDIYKPVSSNISPNYVSQSSHKSPLKRTAESRLIYPSTLDSDDTDSNEMFPMSPYSPLRGMQAKSPPTPVYYDSSDSPIKKLRMDPPDLIHGHTTAFKPSSSVGGDYNSQYKDTCFHADPAAKSIYNSVPLAQQRKGNQDAKPLTDAYVSSGSDDVQTKCFKNTRDTIRRGWAEGSLFDSSSSTSLSSSSGFVKSRVHSQETSSLVRQPKQTPVIDVDDENFFSQFSPSSSRSVLAPKNQPVRDTSRLGRDKPAVSSSPSAAVSEISSSSRSNDGETSKFSRDRSTVSSSQSSGDTSKFSRDRSTVSSSQSSGDFSKFSMSRPTVSSSQSSSESLSNFSSKSRSNTGDLSKFSRDRSTISSSRSSISSSSSKNSGSSSSKTTNKTTTSGSSATASSKNDSAGSSNRRINSGVKQYRIFKSRRPAQPQSPPKELLVEDEEEEDTAININSPPMPELDPELPELFSRERNQEDPHSPPDITDKEETDTDTAAESSQLSQENSDSANNYSQESFTDVPEALIDVDEPMPDLLVRSLDSRDTPSPASVDSPSQDLPQDVSSADNSQKEDVPAAPRRFFKSRKSADTSGLQRKMLKKSQSKFSYNVRSWHQDENVKDKTDLASPPVPQSKSMSFSDDEESSPSTSSVRDIQLMRSVTWPKDGRQQAIMSVKVNPQHKQLYKVVQNVKMAYEVQEEGETQDFMDDIQYLLDNLKDHQSVSIRSLSTIQLAGKCILPAFRMHLRAHGTVTKIFCLLHDACSYPTLALSTAAMMFMLSQDRLNMDLDKQSLNLMLKLNEVDMPRSHKDQEAPEEAVATAEDSVELEKCRQRVQDLLSQLQKESKAAKPFDQESITTGNLAMESLLSLTSRRAGDWFKEELRTLSGLDHFVETVHHCVSAMKEDLAYYLDSYTPILKKLDRCLRVLENITFMNSDNQCYISAYKKGLLITASGRLLLQCVESLPIMPLCEMESEAAMKQQQGWIVFECLLAVLRVLLNITHDCEFGCTRVGAEEGLLQTVLQCVINIQWCVPLDHRFDVLVLSLGLLINLMEHCPLNRRTLVESVLAAQISEEDYPLDMDAVQALVQLFLQRESAAREMEEAPETPVKSNPNLNKSGEWRESESGIEWIARSAEKVKAAEKQRNEAAGEGSSKGGNKTDTAGQGDGASAQEDEETFTKALHKAGKHMENSIVASYVGLLLGCLIQDNHKYAELVSQYLPDGSFDSMIKILKKFLGFMSLTTAIGSTDANSIQRVIDTLEAC